MSDLSGWRAEKSPMARSQLQPTTTLDTALPMADSISRLEEGRLAHGQPAQMTFISGYKYILEQKTEVTAIKIQGRQDYNQWVKTFTISYSNDGTNFKPYQNGKVWKPLNMIANENEAIN